MSKTKKPKDKDAEWLCAMAEACGLNRNPTSHWYLSRIARRLERQPYPADVRRVLYFLRIAKSCGYGKFCMQLVDTALDKHERAEKRRKGSK